jgi:hypothetical protein
MNEDAWTEQTGKIEKIGWGVVRWTIYIVITLLILGASFWFFFYSDYLANNYSVASARNLYQDSYLKTKNLLSPEQPVNTQLNPVYTIQVQKPLKEGSYTYTFVGTFSRLDVAQSLIFLRDKNEKVYPFRIDGYILKDPLNTWLTMFTASNIDMLSSGVVPTDTTSTGDNGPTLTITTQVAIEGSLPTNAPGTIGVRWNDKRTLSQIEADFSKNPAVPVNEASVESTVLVEFK